MREADAGDMTPTEVEIAKSKGTLWLSDDKFAVYTSEYSRTGFQGGFNWYRCNTYPKNLADMAAFAGRKIKIPILYVAGSKDWGTYQEPGLLERMRKKCLMYKGDRLVEGAGHWVQQEQPAEVMKLVLEFVKNL
jgi:pimeloyl-ACP methyl ester carboxylesterase